MGDCPGLQHLQRGRFCLSALLSRLYAARRCAGYRISAYFTMQWANIYVRIVGCLSRGHSVHTTGQSLTEISVCPVERMYSRVSNITHVTIYDNREHQWSAKADAATGAAIHQLKQKFCQSQVPGLSCAHTDPATITATML